LGTSRYHASELIVASGLLPVRITAGAPRGRLGYALAGCLPALYPERRWLSLDPEEFARTYLAHLDAVGVEQIAADLAVISRAHGGRGIVMLCFEDVAALGEHSCHRRAFARWWKQQTTQVVPELEVPSRG